MNHEATLRYRFQTSEDRSCGFCSNIMMKMLLLHHLQRALSIPPKQAVGKRQKLLYIAFIELAQRSDAPGSTKGGLFRPSGISN